MTIAIVGAAATLLVGAVGCSGMSAPEATGDGGKTDAGADAGPPCPKGIIVASSYDQSCKVDTDCESITEGNTCVPCTLTCANAAINVDAQAQWVSDIAKTTAPSLDTSCPVCVQLPGPCCRAGKCQLGSQCGALDAAAE
jgi:hypothetical protein